MSSTILSYKERHVPVPESSVIAVGYMIFYEAWLNAIRPEEKLRFEQMSGEFRLRTIGVGCTDLGLDQILRRDPIKETEFLAFVKLVRFRLYSFGKEVPPEYVTQVMAPHEPDWKDTSWPTPWLHKVLDIIESLIQGGRIPSKDWLSNFTAGNFPNYRTKGGGS
jgi:hypothetical protein